jgi:glyoxylase-like metal-dependent hydrolase (beta-lactamase superfamily II)
VRPRIFTHFDRRTSSATYIVAEPEGPACAIIDAVLDYDAPSGRAFGESASAVEAIVARENLKPVCVLETHIHADHLSAGARLAARFGAPLLAGDGVRAVQDVVNRQLGFVGDRAARPADFDRLLADGETIALGRATIVVRATPGHTPACVTYLCGDAAFVGDTLFMPDSGTARCDFPGGDARRLLRSIRERILSLPDETRLFLCHDYGGPARTVTWQTSVAAERRDNIHVHDEIDEDSYVAMRTARDKTLSLPNLFWPAVQFNIFGKRDFPRDGEGCAYLKIPFQID